MNNEVLERPESNKGKRITIIVIGVVICILALSGGAYAYINSTPEAKVLNAIKATSNELESNKGIIEKTVGEDYAKTLREKGLNENMKFSLNSTNIPKLSEFTNSGFSLDLSQDRKNKKLLFDLGGQYKGTNIGNVKFYTDNNKLMLSVPQIYDAWFTCDAENIEQQYNNSIFSKNKKLPDKEITLKLFGDDNDSVLEGKELMDAVMKGYLTANSDKLAAIGKNIKVKESKQTKNIEIGGSSEECQGYDVVISGQDAKDFISSITDYMLKDQELKKAITKQAKYSYLQQDKKYDSPEAMVDDIYKQLEDGNEKFKNSFNIDDVNAVVYIDKKGRAVSLDLDTALNIDSKKTEIKFSGDLKGTDNLGNLMDMSMNFTKDGKEFKVNFDSNTTTKDDLINEEMNLVLDDSIEAVNLTGKSSYNTKSGDFDVSLDAKSKDEGLNASLAGNLKFDKSSKKLEADFNKIDLQSNLKDGNFNISLDGSYAIAPLDSPIEEPTGEKLEVFKLSQSKLMEVSQQIQNNAMKIYNTLKTK